MLKNILLISFIGLFLNLNAQQTICFGETYTYTVDALESPTGTVGSTYNWTVISTGFNGTIISNSNSATIDWDNSPAGIYTIQVIESNNGCDGLAQTLQVTINPVPTLPSLSVVADTICFLDNASFIIEGTPNTNVTYSINGGVSQTITLNASGQETITLTNVTGTQTLNILSITSVLGCTLDFLTISQTVNVNELILTSPIGF